MTWAITQVLWESSDLLSNFLLEYSNAKAKIKHTYVAAFPKPNWPQKTKRKTWKGQCQQKMILKARMFSPSQFINLADDRCPISYGSPFMGITATKQAENTKWKWLKDTPKVCYVLKGPN